MTNVIRIAAAVITDAAGRILLVRKRDTTTWMQPGGKIEPGELAAATLARELLEELGLHVDPSTFDYWGRFHADAANEAHHVVDAEVFRVSISAAPLVAAEIDELRWIDVNSPHGLAIAPLSLEHVFPLLGSR